MINLANNTITKTHINRLSKWLQTYPRLTKGEITLEFEKQFSQWLGAKYAVYVNSGSSANLAMLYALKLSGKLRNNKVIVPAISWATTVAPLIQLGFTPIICDIDLANLGLDTSSCLSIIHEHNPAAILAVHVLGFPCDIGVLANLCRKRKIVLLEDSCETLGSTYKDKKTGNFGLMSTFSFYYGHHMSTIEGGMICTNNYQMWNLLKMVRNHGWDRDLDSQTQTKLRTKYSISDFNALYTFYQPGFNLRATDLQAFIGLMQLEDLDKMCIKREENFNYYDKNLNPNRWRIKAREFCSNMAYPIMTPKRDELAKVLIDNGIETRPLVCGSMSQQPFIKDRKILCYNIVKANAVHKYGLYIPNHTTLTKKNLKFICKIVNGVLCD